MFRSALLIFCVLCAAILIGCSKTETSNSNTAENSNKAATITSTPATTTASTGDKVGIPECDDFITKYEACVSGKVPEMARGPFEASLKSWRAEWKRLADNPQTRGTLAAGCKQAAEQANSSMKSYGCAF